MRQQPTTEQPDALRKTDQALLSEEVVLGYQPLEGGPVHAFGLAPLAVQDARRPAQAFPDRIDPAPDPVLGGLTLGGVDEPVTVPTGEDRSTV